MLFARSTYHIVPVVVLLLLVCSPSVSATTTLEGVIDAIASRLERSQVEDGVDDGLWEAEPLFTGPIVAGLTCAVECTGSPIYKTICNSAGWNIMKTARDQGYLLGDEAYALIRLSDIADIPQGPSVWGADYWRNAVVDFYESVRDPAGEGSAEAYLAYFEGMEPSLAVYYLAHHVTAAYSVDDPDKEVWRDALVQHLSLVDDASDYPVMALGAATWALAATEGLDDTPVASAAGSPYWEGVVLSDLPALLLSHQVTEQDDVFAGSFYWRFDHSAVVEGGIGFGYTEDAVYGTLGLIAAAAASDDPASEEIVNAITAAQQALLDGVDVDGNVYQHLALVGETYHVYAGEMLQALWGTKLYLDFVAELEAAGTAEGAFVPTGG